jgi:hypothetical protein
MSYFPANACADSPAYMIAVCQDFMAAGQPAAVSLLLSFPVASLCVGALTIWVVGGFSASKPK